MKGITPVIGVILVMVLFIAVAATAFVWISSTTQEAMQTAEQQMQSQASSKPELMILKVDENQVYVKNTGKITLSQVKFYVNDVAIDATGPETVAVNDVGVYALDKAQMSGLPDVAEVKASAVGFSDMVNAVIRDIGATVIDMGTILSPLMSGIGTPAVGTVMAESSGILFKDSSNGLIAILTDSGDMGIGVTSPAARLDINGGMILEPTTAPASPQNGYIYYDSSQNKFKCFENGVWKDCAGGGGNSSGAGTYGYYLTRNIGSNINDWVEIGNITDNSKATYAFIRIWGQFNNNMFIDEFQVYMLSNGTQTSWVELAATQGKNYNAPQDFAVDAKKLSAGNNTGIDLRIRRIRGGGTTGAVSVVVESNSPLVESTASGAAGTVGNGYLGANSWKFPVTSDQFLNTTQGLFIDQNGNVGIGTTGPAAKLEITGGEVYVTNNGGNPRYVLGDSTSGGNYGSMRWESTNDTLQLGTDTGGYALNLLETGNVGIGTTNPAQKLSVAGVIESTTGGIKFPDGTTQTTAASGSGAAGWGINGTNVYNSTANVGIGTASPSARLNIYGTSNSNDSYLKIQNGGDVTVKLGQDTASTGHNEGKLQLSDNGVLKTVIRAAGDSYIQGGNVGIGTTGPGYPLDVQAATASIQTKSTTGTNIAYQRFVNTAGNFVIGQEGSAGGGLLTGDTAYAAVLTNDGAYPMQFGTSNTVRMTILSGGNVGIGTASPGGYRLAVLTTGTQALAVQSASSTVGSPMVDLYDSGRVVEAVISSTDGSTTGTYIASYSNHPLMFSTNHAAAQMTIATTGNVGIGTSPGAKLDVNGLIRNSAPSQGTIELSGLLPGYADNTYPTLKTSGSDLYFSVNGHYSAYLEDTGLHLNVGAFYGPGTGLTGTASSLSVGYAATAGGGWTTGWSGTMICYTCYVGSTPYTNWVFTNGVLTSYSS